MRHRIPWLFTALLGLLHATAGHAAVRFLVDDLGTLGGDSAWARAINDGGAVAGGTLTAVNGGTAPHAFVWRPGALGGTASDPFHGQPGEVRAIDSAGQVYGWANFAGEAHSQAVYTGVLPGLFRVFPAGTYSQATAGQAGRVTGWCQAAAACGWRGFVHEPLGNTTLLGAPGSVVTPQAMNTRGLIVGSMETGPSHLPHAFQSLGQGLTDLGVAPGDTTSWALAVNDDGLAVGWGSDGSGVRRALRFGPAGPQRLGTLGGAQSEARGVNQAGQIVGTADTLAGQARGFISMGAGLVDLNTLTTGRGPLIARADAVNRDGQIAATSDSGHALRLTPSGTLLWWPHGGNGRLADASHWNSLIGFAPNPLLSATIAPGVPTDVTADADATLQQLTVGQQRSGGAPVTLWLQSGSTVRTRAGTVLWPLATLGSQGDGRLAGGLDNHGTVQLDVLSTLTIDPPFTNRGRVLGRTVLINGQPAGTNTLHTQLVNDAAGVVTVSDQQTVTLDGALQVNDGLLQVQAGSAATGARLSTSGRLDNRATGQATVRNGALVSTLGLVNDGLVQGFEQATLSGPLTNHAGGRVIARAGCTLVFDGPVVNDGLIAAEPGATLVFKVLPVTGSGTVQP